MNFYITVLIYLLARFYVSFQDFIFIAVSARYNKDFIVIIIIKP